MRAFIAVLVLIFSFQSWTNANDIRDFEIEGISIGDSLLDYFSEETIKAYTRDDIKGKFYIVSIPDSKFQDYDSIDFYLKTNDRKYKIHSIGGIIFFPNQIEKCKIKKKEVLKALEKSLNQKFISGQLSHQLDKSGKSIQYQSYFMYDSGANLRVECYDWTNKMKKKYLVEDLLQVSIVSETIQRWIESGYK